MYFRKIFFKNFYLKLGASRFPPIRFTQSGVNFMSGSKPRLPPGDDSNMKPKSENERKTDREVYDIQIYLFRRLELFKCFSMK